MNLKFMDVANAFGEEGDKRKSTDDPYERKKATISRGSFDGAIADWRSFLERHHNIAKMA